MRKCILIYSIVIFSINLSFGQKNEYKKLSEIEQTIINDLSSAFKDTSISFLLSPFIIDPIDITILDNNELTSKYGFNKNDLKGQKKDTILLEKNDYFKIVNYDSLKNWQKIDTKESFQDPVLDKISKYYKKSGLCSFNKVTISKNKGFALVEYWIHCGMLCGFGETVLMKKVKNKWIIIDTLKITES